MEPIAPVQHIQHFITTVCTRTDPHSDVLLHQSINAWRSYYGCLHRLLTPSSPAEKVMLQACFYPFANAALTHLAETFCALFALPWTRTQISHTRLTHAFPALCAEKNLQGDMVTLYALMCELDVRISTRNCIGVPHSAPRLWHSLPLPPPDHLSALLTCMNQYLVTLLQFCAENLDKSSLSHPTPVEPVYSLK